MQKTKCALCDNFEPFDVIYHANFKPEDFDERVFSARRLPDRIHYQIVKCRLCGLTYSNPIEDTDKLAQLYTKSSFNYDSQVPYLRKTYGKYLSEAITHLEETQRYLDIGCGNGFMLEEAKSLSFEEVYGVEPSIDAANKSKKGFRKNIVVSAFKDGLLAKDFFDLISVFQTLDHIVNPNEFLGVIHKNLKKGGLVLAINHDIGSLTNQILGERSPVIDIEHTYLYNKETMAKLFEKNGFEVVWVGSVTNTYPLNYWLRLAPIPFKSQILDFLQATKLGNINLELSAGNLGLIGRKI